MKHKGGKIQIYPFIRGHLNGNSIDLMLGPNFFRQDGNGGWDKAVLEPGEKLPLPPKTYVLAHTVEFIGGLKDVAFWLKPTSTALRHGIEVKPGFGDTGFLNRWALEIFNYGHEVKELEPGMRLCQLVFSDATTALQVYGSHVGSYQKGTEIFGIMQDWKPEDILPKDLKTVDGWKDYYDNPLIV